MSGEPVYAYSTYNATENQITESKKKQWSVRIPIDRMIDFDEDGNIVNIHHNYVTVIKKNRCFIEPDFEEEVKYIDEQNNVVENKPKKSCRVVLYPNQCIPIGVDVKQDDVKDIGEANISP